MTDRTFLTPLNEAEDHIRQIMSGLDELVYAFQVTGNVKLAIRLRDFQTGLTKATRLLEEGRSMALSSQLIGAEQATVNMISAALAVANR